MAEEEFDFLQKETAAIEDRMGGVGNQPAELSRGGTFGNWA